MEKKPRIAIYSAIFGNNDNLIDPREKIEGADLICFTNRDDFVSEHWNIVRRPRYYENDILNAKVYKLLPHYFLPDYDYTVWVDGRIVIRSRNIVEYAKNILEEFNWAMYRHESGRSVTEEAEKCVEWKLADPIQVKRQMREYARSGFDLESSIYSAGVIFRRSLEHNVIHLGEDWWREIRKHTLRDQLSFPYVVWQNHFDIHVIDEPLTKNDYFWVIKHVNNPKYAEYAKVLGIANGK